MYFLMVIGTQLHCIAAHNLKDRLHCSKRWIRLQICLLKMAYHFTWARFDFVQCINGAPPLVATALITV